LVDGSVFVHDGEQEARVDAALLAVGVGFLVVTVIAGHARHSSAKHFDKTDRRILRDIAKTLKRRNGFLRIHAEVLHRFTHSVDHAVTSGFGATERATATEGFTGKHTRRVLTDEAGIFIHHPTHHLRGGADIG